MKKIIVLLLVVMAAAACDDPECARKTLDDSGFDSIVLTGPRYFSCGQDDVTSTGFTARNPRGKVVSGVVCCGWSKGCTVRF